MEITRETDYAVRCMLFLSMAPGEAFMVGEIAERQCIPKSFLAKILQKLVKMKTVRSTRGIKGGFQLAKSPKNISLLEVIEAVQGPILLNTCVIGQKSCKRSKYCSVHPVWVDIRKGLRRKLDAINFGILARKEKAFIEGEQFK